MVDLLGPADAGSVNTLTTTTDVTSPVAGDTWFKDCAGGASGTGTNEVALYINRYLQQLRQAIRKSNVPMSNAYDNMLSWAIQSGYPNWASTAGGTANALTGSVNNAPLEIEVGTLIRLEASATNTGASTFNLNTLGVDPIKDIGGAALTGGEIVAGNTIMLIRYPSSWRLISPLPFSWFSAQLATMDVQTFDSSGTWTKPAGFAAGSRVIIEIWSGGAGGGPFWGGLGGDFAKFETVLNRLPSTAAVIVGAGGLGSDNVYPHNGPDAGGASYFAYSLYGNFYSVSGAAGVLGTSDPSYNRATPTPSVPDAAEAGGRAPTLPGFAFVPTDVFWSGGGGAQWNGVSGSAGVSVLAGSGGAIGSAGNVPAGGGGCVGAVTGTGFAGAHGRVRVTTIQGG